MPANHRVWIFMLVLAAAVVQVGTPATAATKRKLPDACALITKSDVATAFAKLETALQPTGVSDPVRSKPRAQGGQGPNACETSFALPNSVGGDVLVVTNPVTKQTPCPPKGQPGKTVTISGTKALLEPVPSKPKVVRDVTFVDQGACAFIEIFLSGGTAKVPESAFVDLAKAALAKKANATSTPNTASSRSATIAATACGLLSTDQVTALLGAAPADSAGTEFDHGPDYKTCSWNSTATNTRSPVNVAVIIKKPLGFVHGSQYDTTETISGLGDSASFGSGSYGTQLVADKGRYSISLGVGILSGGPISQDVKDLLIADVGKIFTALNA